MKSIDRRGREPAGLAAARRHFRAALTAANDAEYTDELGDAADLREIATRIRRETVERFGVDLSDELNDSKQSI